MATSIQSLDSFQKPTSYYSPSIRAKYHRIEDTSSPKVAPQEWADIGYHPNLAQYLTRSTKVIPAGRSINRVPHGWPQLLQGPLVWTSSDFRDDGQLVYFLSDFEKGEIRQALEFFKGTNQHPSGVAVENFPLPSLGPRLRKAQDQVYNGCGLVIIRGLDADAYDDVDITIIFLGVSSYIAEKRGKQDQRGTMMAHVFSHYKGEKDNDRGRYEMPFHADVVCDTLALFTRDCAAAGGHGIFASSWTVYNELAAKRPDLIHVLASPDWPLDTFGRTPSYHNQALLFHQDRKVMLSASRRLLTGSPYTPRTEGLPGLTEAQAEALDAIHFIAKDNSIKIPMMKGDMRFMNNMALIHARDAYTDNESSQRHLLRLWLSCSDQMWKLPPSLQLAWDRVFEDVDRLGVWDCSPVKISDGTYVLETSCD